MKTLSSKIRKVVLIGYDEEDVKKFIKDLKFIMPSTFHETIEELAGDGLL